MRSRGRAAQMGVLFRHLGINMGILVRDFGVMGKKKKKIISMWVFVSIFKVFASDFVYIFRNLV